MKILKTAWKWKKQLEKRSRTSYIVLHHSAASVSSATDIDRWHKNNGYSGIGYHFVIRKNGEIYEGRPIDTVGAHCLGYNSNSVGICFEGNFETEKPTDKQIKSGYELINYIKGIYPNISVKGHRDLYATACPGKNFNINSILNYTEVKEVKEITSVNDIVWELAQRGIISDKALWLTKLEEDKNAYWLARKMIEYLRKAGV